LKTLKIYISGPITGVANRNREAFADAAFKLDRLGYAPVNPHLVKPDHDGSCRGDLIQEPSHRYGCYMRADLRALLECDGIYMLAGWELSQGARCEFEVARLCGLLLVDEEGRRTRW
jgi:hypothetical protein